MEDDLLLLECLTVSLAMKMEMTGLLLPLVHQFILYWTIVVDYRTMSLKASLLHKHRLCNIHRPDLQTQTFLITRLRAHYFLKWL